MEMYLLSHLSKRFLDVFIHLLACLSIEVGIQKLLTPVIDVLLGVSGHLR